MEYNWQQADWPNFRYDERVLGDRLFLISEKTGRLSGLLEALPEGIQTDAIIDVMVSEAIKTSEIEGEFLSRQDVMSSIRKNLGFHQGLQRVGDRRATGIAELMVHVRNNVHQRLSQKTLFSWHTMVMKGSVSVASGAWRRHAEPMRIVSGTIGSEQVHFEAPPSENVPGEMRRFIQWFNHTRPGGTTELQPASIRAAIAHIYFESIHPFEDGNGRIGRALAELALSQGSGHPLLLSLSQTIKTNRAAYYDALKQGQRSNEITAWLLYFTDLVLAAQKQAEETIEFTLKKTRLLDRIQHQLNERQMRVVQRMLKEGPEGFKGGMTARKYQAITGTTKVTATRDLQDLSSKGVLTPHGGGRSVHYTFTFLFSPKR